MYYLCGLRTIGIVLCVSEVFEDDENEVPNQEAKVILFCQKDTLFILGE